MADDYQSMISRRSHQKFLKLRERAKTLSRKRVARGKSSLQYPTTRTAKEIGKATAPPTRAKAKGLTYGGGPKEIKLLKKKETLENLLD